MYDMDRRCKVEYNRMRVSVYAFMFIRFKTVSFCFLFDRKLVVRLRSLNYIIIES